MDSTTNNLQLDDTSRTKLDSIVLKMASQNAPKEDVQAVVADFKQKYGKPVESAQAEPAEQTRSQKIGNTLLKILPGSQLLKDVGHSASAIFQGAKGGIQKLMGNESGAKESFLKSNTARDKIDPLKDFGSAANLGLTAAIPVTGGGSTLLRKVGANAVLGAGMGTASAVSQGAPAKDVATQAGFGALTGGLATGLGGVASKAVQSLPPRIVKQVLPQLKNPETVDYALKNLKFGSVESMVKGSRKALDAYDSEIQSILKHPKYASKPIQGATVADSTLKQFPNSEYTLDGIFEKMKSQLPSEAKIFTSLQKGGSLPIEEANRLRQQIDRITYKTAIDSPEVKAGKELASAFGNTLRTLVQDTAPETKAIFSNYSKEINLTKALEKLANKTDKASFVNMKDLLFGGMVGGLPGAAISAGAKKLSQSPTVRIGAAKGIKYLAPSVIKSGNILGKAGAMAGKIPLKK